MKTPIFMMTLMALTIFISAFLLFLLQPMMGKAILPMVGGAPDVWLSCMLFYQATLFLGYLYAHILSTRFPIRKQFFVHSSIILFSLLALPIGLDWQMSAHISFPPVWVLYVLATAIGIPFFIVSTTAPLLQKWFSLGQHKNRHNPYFLYAVSNAGSLMALLFYPTLIEPIFRLSQQMRFWDITYLILSILLVTCGFIISRQDNDTAEIKKAVSPVSNAIRIKWLLLAFCPSSLMLGLTAYITTELSPMPLIWVVPLLLYLITFIISFGMFSFIKHKVTADMQALAVAALIGFFYIYNSNFPLMIAHLIFFFLTALVCHGELYLSRPKTDRLTEFYLIVSFGGMLGGLFNSILAPFLFNTLFEYPLILLASLFLRPGKFLKKSSPQVIYRDFTLPILLFFIMTTTLLYLKKYELYNSDIFALGIMFIMGVLFAIRERKVRFALCICAIFASAVLSSGTNDILSPTSKEIAYAGRNFYGTKRVVESDYEGYNVRTLFHGTTIHGIQARAFGLAQEPLTYYSKEGPLGWLFNDHKYTSGKWNIAVIGLGTGAAACLSSPEQTWDFYEIDPQIIALSTEKKLFTYLDLCTPEANIIKGDARIALQDAPDGKYDLIVLDAFSSISIPSHLLTTEAFKLYFSKLKEGGIIMMHVSNRSFKIEDIIANVINDMGYYVVINNDRFQKKLPLNMESSWMIAVKSAEDLKYLDYTWGWTFAPKNDNIGTWSDDFYNLIEVIRL